MKFLAALSIAIDVAAALARSNVSEERQYIPTVIWAAASLVLLTWSISVVDGASLRYVIASFWLSAEGRLPLRSLRFLAAATDARLLNQSGRAYRFRYPMMQHALARPESSGDPLGTSTES